MNCMLISKKTMLSMGFTKLKEDFDLDDKTVSKAFLNLKTVSSETFVRSFQFNFQMILSTLMCDQPKQVMSQRTLAHFVKLIQKRSFIYFMNVLSQIFSLKNLKTSGSQFQMRTKSFCNETCSLGSQGKSDLLNYFIILAKLHTSSNRRFVKSPNFDVFKEMVDIKYRTKKYIASKKQQRENFRQNGRYIKVIDQKCICRENSLERDHAKMQLICVHIKITLNYV